MAVLGLLMVASLGIFAVDAMRASGVSASAMAQTTGNPVNNPNATIGAANGEDNCPGALIQIAGTGRCTHGSDPLPDGAEIGGAVFAEGGAPPITCDGDGTSGNRVQVLYARASNTTSRFSAYKATFQSIAAYANQIYRDSAAETGGNRSIRFVHDSSCRISVLEVVLTSGGAGYFNDTIKELYSKGYDDANRKYMIFMDANFYCGIGDYYGDDRETADNYNNFGPNYGRTDVSCWGYPEVLAHELMHNLGAVQQSAPHSTEYGHCYDEWEVMCYADGTSRSMQAVCTPELARDAKLFDCRHDDYFHTNPSGTSYLGTHWNAANSRFLIGAGTTGPPPGTLTLSKAKSKFNGPVEATVTGLQPNSSVTLRWPREYEITSGPNDGDFTTLLDSATTDAEGRAAFSFRTPLEPLGDYKITARDSSGGKAEATLRVIPRIMLNETEGPTSTTLRVYFYGFGPGDRIDVRWHADASASSSFKVLKTITAASNGRASSIVTIPSNTGTGARLVVGKVVGVSRSASTPFEVTAGGASTDGTAMPTGTPTPVATPTSEPTETPVTEPTETATPEPVPTETATPEPTATDTPVPNASPVAVAGEDQIVTDTDGSGDEPVQLDGSGSTDPEGAALGYAWSVDGTEVATGSAPSLTLSVGTTTVLLTVTDEQGATATDEVSITVAAPPTGGETGAGEGE